MTTGQLTIVTFYAAVLPVWAALSAWCWHRATQWSYTPRWHRTLVPVFRAAFLLTMPLEMLIAARPFVLPVFVLGALGTIGWLGHRGLTQ